MYRRGVLRSVGVGIVVLAAGCTESPDAGESETTRQTDAATSPTSSPTTTRPATPTDTPTPSPTPRVGTVEIDVGPGVVFRPSSVVVAAGTTVRWVWRSDNHNVAVQERPAESDWGGHTTIENAGFEYEHTFAVPGAYRYVCEPHLRDGMIGSLTVV